MYFDNGPTGVLENWPYIEIGILQHFSMSI